MNPSENKNKIHEEKKPYRFGKKEKFSILPKRKKTKAANFSRLGHAKSDANEHPPKK